MTVLHGKRRYFNWIRGRIGLAGALSYFAALAAHRLSGGRLRPSHLVREPVTGRFLSARLGSTDLRNFEQIFLEREYACIDAEIRAAETVIDCGAYVGYSAHYFLSLNPRLRVFALEPHASNFKALRRNLARYAGRTTLLNEALWDETGRIGVVDGGPNREWETTVAASPAGAVPATTLSDLLRRCGVARIDVLKVDVEGAETRVFAAADRDEWLSRTSTLVIEIHGDEARRSVEAALAAYEFRHSTSGELDVYTGLRPKARA